MIKIELAVKKTNVDARKPESRKDMLLTSNCISPYTGVRMHKGQISKPLFRYTKKHFQEYANANNTSWPVQENPKVNMTTSRIFSGGLGWKAFFSRILKSVFNKPSFECYCVIRVSLIYYILLSLPFLYMHERDFSIWEEGRKRRSRQNAFGPLFVNVLDPPHPCNQM